MDPIGFEGKMCFAFLFFFLIYVPCFNGSSPQLSFVELQLAYRMQITTLFNKIELLDQTR